MSNLVNLKYSDSERRSGARQRAPFSSPLGCRRHSGVRAAPTRRRMPRTLGRVVACSGGRGEIIAAAHNALPRVQPVNCGAHLEEHQPALRLAGAHQPALRTDGEPLASGVPARGQRERLRCPGLCRRQPVARQRTAIAVQGPCNTRHRGLHRPNRLTLASKHQRFRYRGVRPERSRPLTRGCRCRAATLSDGTARFAQ